MNNKVKSKKGLQPKMRFPQFRNAEDWEVKPLGEICNVLNNCRRPISSIDRKKGRYPYYGASGIVDYVNDYIFDERLLLVGEDGAKWGAYERTAFIAEGKYWVNNHAHVLKPTQINDVLLESFLVMIDISPFITGAAPPKLTLGKLKDIPIPLSKNLKEQQKIADCVSSLDELIQAEDQKLRALQQHKKGLMQELFPAEGKFIPKRRFPEFSALGNWKKKPLGTLANFASGGTPSKDNPDYWNGTIPWISASSMYDIYFNKSDLNVTPLAIKDGARIAKKGALLILVRGSMLYNRVPMGIATADVAFNQDVKALTLQKDINAEFLLQQLLAYESRINVDKTGIGAGKIETDELKNLAVYIPGTLQEQKKIAEFFSSINSLITEQSQKLNALRNHKNGLMQQLFPAASEAQK